MFLNRQHAKRREERGKHTQIVDESMMKKDQIANSKVVGIEGDDAHHHQRSLEEDNAMHDMSDLQNEDFIYVY